MACPGVKNCRRTCPHRQSVLAYREAREAQSARAEIEGVGYATETATFYQEHGRITFGWWLQQNKREKENA